MKTIIFGGLDGILTAHAVIAAAVGAKLSPAHALRHVHMLRLSLRLSHLPRVRVMVRVRLRLSSRQHMRCATFIWRRYLLG